jgi:glycopeptide antibiotics resistance protein
MNCRKIGRICAFSYLFLYMSAMIMPRMLPDQQFSPTRVNFLSKIFHQLLYYGGPLEPVANFLFLMPIFAILICKLGQTSDLKALYLCISLSAFVEIAQIYIPGRVSSIFDFLLNSLGALVAFSVLRIGLRLYRKLS